MWRAKIGQLTEKKIGCQGAATQLFSLVIKKKGLRVDEFQNLQKKDAACLCHLK